jgi:post-segregation antitoxin (ccd killing protein)
MRKKLTLRVDSELIEQARIHGINISRLTEKAISEYIRTCTYMHVQTATI